MGRPYTGVVVSLLSPSVADPVADHRRRAGALALAAVAVVASVAAVLGALLGAPLVGLGVGLVLGALVAALAWRGADGVVLAGVGARAADPVAHARLHNLVEGLGAAAGVAKPAVFVVDDPGLNVMVAGRDPRRTSLVVTSGVLDLPRIELEGVLAHAVARLRSGSTAPDTLAVALVGGALVLLERARRSPSSGARVAVVLAPVAPLAARLLARTVSSDAAALADARAVGITRYPPGLIGGLEKLRDRGTAVAGATAASAHLWLADPLGSGPRPSWASSLPAHPPLDARIEALREL